MYQCISLSMISIISPISRIVQYTNRPIFQQTNTPIHQYTNTPIHQQTKSPVDQYTNRTVDQQTNRQTNCQLCIMGQSVLVYILQLLLLKAFFQMFLNTAAICTSAQKRYILASEYGSQLMGLPDHRIHQTDRIAGFLHDSLNLLVNQSRVYKYIFCFQFSVNICESLSD